MDIGDVFRRFFGFPSRIPRNWDSRDDIYRDAPYDDGDDDVGQSHPGSRPHQGPSFEFFFGHPNGKGGLDDMFEHFHGDMWRQMEALHQQMEEMMKGFGAADFPSVGEPPSPPRIGDSDEKSKDKSNPFSWFQTPSPFFGQSPNSRTNPRDFMLKDGKEPAEQPSVPFNPDASHPTENEPGTIPIFSMPSRRKPKEERREDTDLDGKLSEKEILSLIEKPQSQLPSEHQPQQHPPQQRQPRFFSSGSSVTFTTIQGADGKMEQKKVVRDSSGHEETTVTRSLGDQAHTVTTITEKDGRQEKLEKFQNMDEKDMGLFEEQWGRARQRPRIPTDRFMAPAPMPRIDNGDQDLFSRFFGWRDK